MKIFNLFLFLILILKLDATYCQSIDSLTGDEKIIYREPQIHPVFPGGEKKLYCFIYRTIDTALMQNRERNGAIYINFVIDTTGKPKDFKILRSVDKVADDEFMRVLKLMRNWEPGYLLSDQNKKIEVTCIIPLILPFENKFCR